MSEQLDEGIGENVGTQTHMRISTLIIQPNSTDSQTLKNLKPTFPSELHTGANRTERNVSSPALKESRATANSGLYSFLIWNLSLNPMIKLNWKTLKDL